MKYIWFLTILIILILLIGLYLFYPKVFRINKNKTVNVSENLTKNKMGVNETITPPAVKKVKETEVYVYSDHFSPSSITIPRNSKILWINQEGNHTLTCHYIGGENIPIEINFVNKGDRMDFPFFNPGTVVCEDVENAFSMQIKIE